MQRLIAFENLSLDGYYVDRNGEMTWAKVDNKDEEFNAFTTQNVKGNGALIFGRVTYNLMAGFWPTPQARQLFPPVAERMNSARKIVFSRTLDQAAWNKTEVLRGELVAEIERLKGGPGEGLAILGSGSLVAQLAPYGLIDEYQIVVNPTALGAGRSLFDGVKNQLNFKLTHSRVFKNGKVFLTYAPAK
jgi:dihydrofolate reductase